MPIHSAGERGERDAQFRSTGRVLDGSPRFKGSLPGQSAACALNVLSLQKLAGNHAVQQLVGMSTAVQRVVGKASALVEEKYVVVGPGQAIQFTALSAGCMAVTVRFQGGGGAGVHLAMLPEDGALQQWSDFFSAIHGRTIVSAHLDGEFVGEQGWRVKAGEPAPRSSSDLVFNGNLPLETLTESGWKNGLTDIKEWFGEKFGVTPTSGSNTKPQYTF